VDLFVPRKTRKDKKTQKTQRKKSKTTNNKQICHHRIVATAFARGLGTQNNRNVFLILTLISILIAVRLLCVSGHQNSIKKFLPLSKSPGWNNII